METVRITKLIDKLANAGEIHPNGYDKGSVIEGNMFRKLRVGERFIVGGIGTSTVTRILDDNMFETRNSTYKIEYLD